MRNKFIVITLIILSVVLAILVGVYFVQKNKLPVDFADKTTSTTKSPIEAGTQEGAGDDADKIITDDFSINLPDGWKQTAASMGATAMVVNSNEHITDSAAQKINFQSYFAVVYGTLDGKSMKEYTQIVKNSLQQKFGSVVFAKEQDLTINGQPVHQIEIEINQQGVNFKVLLVLIKGQADDAWMLSFNTTKSNWEDYKEIFYTTADSFIVKE